MNTAYKILAQAISLRIQPFLLDLIHNTQTGFVHGKSIFYNIFSFWEASKWSIQSNQKLAILLLDFEKAYDKVDWDFLECTLHRFGFTDAWIRGVY